MQIYPEYIKSFKNSDHNTKMVCKRNIWLENNTGYLYVFEHDHIKLKTNTIK